MRLGHLKEFVLELRGQETGQNARPRGNPLPPPLGVIEVIHAALKGTLVTRRKRVLAMVPIENCRKEQPLRKRAKCVWEPIAIDDEDLEGTT